MDQYHGTNNNIADDLIDSKISVNFGGGELGKGFYTGDLPHEAFNWAWHQYKGDKAVVHFKLEDNDLLRLNPKCFDHSQTLAHRKKIKNSGETRFFLFNENAIWAPVVGKIIPNFNQIKFESKASENYLNSSIVTKIKI